jgi:hypothetical protein
MSMLLGAYFHQGWIEEFGYSDIAVDKFVSANPSGLRDCLRELDVLLLSLDSELDGVLDRFLCNYWPQADGITPRDWFLELRDRFTAASSLA